MATKTSPASHEREKKTTHISSSLTRPVPDTLPQCPPFPLLLPQELLHGRQETRIVREDIFADAQDWHAAVSNSQGCEVGSREDKGPLADGEGGVYQVKLEAGFLRVGREEVVPSYDGL